MEHWHSMWLEHVTDPVIFANLLKKWLPLWSSMDGYRGLTVKWSSILCFERSKIWPKVPFYRKFHFIPKNSADFRKSSIFRIFQSLHYFSCFWWISLKFRTFFDKILKFEKFHFANFESFLTESSILSKVPFYPEKPSKVLRPKSSILSWFHFTVRSL